MNNLSDTNFEKISNDWLISHSVGKKDATINQYKSQIKLLNTFFNLFFGYTFGYISIKDISYFHVNYLENFFFCNDFAISTKSTYKNTLSQILNYAIQQKIISKNPCTKLKVKKIAHIKTHPTVIASLSF